MKTKVIHFEKAKKKIRDNRRHRYNARDAYVHFLYQEKYKINSELSDLITLKYKTVSDGQKVLGAVDGIKNMFISFQKYLYQQNI